MIALLGFLKAVPAWLWVAVVAGGALLYGLDRAEQAGYDRGVAEEREVAALAKADLEKRITVLQAQADGRAAQVEELKDELDNEARADSRATERVPTADELRRLKERFGGGAGAR